MILDVAWKDKPLPDEPLTPTRAFAKRIREMRTQEGWTQPQLAERCQAAGLDWDRSIIANVEAGRRGSITVQELLTLAYVFNTAPVLLLFPVGRVAAVEPWPGRVLDTWDAARWFTGEAQIRADGTIDTSAELAPVPMYLWRGHDRWIQEYTYLVTERSLWETHGEDRDRAGRLADAALRRVRDIRGEMRRHGLTPPALAEDLRHIDERRHVYLTPEQVDEHIAEHPGDLRFVDHSPANSRPVVQPGSGARIREAQEFARNYEPGPLDDGPDDDTEPPTAR